MRRRTLTTEYGFTLIELLVVIAIIAILAAVLFPVFARVKAKAHQNTCLSNVKQLAFAGLMYASDWDDVLPPGRTGGGWEAWYYVVAPWGDPATLEVYPGCGVLGQYIKDPNIAVCPDWKTDMAAGAVAVWAKSRFLSYGNNDLIPGKAITELLLPTQMIMVAENSYTSNCSSIWYAPTGPSSYRPAMRHGGGKYFTAGFCDGHGKACPSGEYWSSGGAGRYWDPAQQVVVQWD